MRAVVRAFRNIAVCLLLLASGIYIALDQGWLHRLSERDRPGGGETAWVTDAVNLRAGPSTGSDVLQVLPAGTVVTVLADTSGGFRAVEIDGTRAWIHGDYLGQAPPDGTGAAALPIPGMQEAVAAPADNAGDDSGMAPDAGSDNTRAPADQPTGERWIDVDRGTRTVTLYIGDQPQASFIGKLGWDTSPDGFYATAIGTYHIFTKHEGLTSTPFVEDVYMTEFVGFDPLRHNGFHSPIRDATGALLPSQNATTLGCIRLEEEAARELYAFAEIGMRVEIHD